jgi:hypothetical protein
MFSRGGKVLASASKDCDGPIQFHNDVFIRTIINHRDSLANQRQSAPITNQHNAIKI